MSKTSIKERNKAIRLAWEREQRLVVEGKGTRDWSEDQQKDILDPDKGKAYDENGRAYEGQHMKSVAEYPEYQGDPDNIQFLTRDEHLEAHKGSWQNPTNWYFNPENKEFVDFGDNKPVPCAKTNLSEPVCSPVIDSQNKSDDLKEPSQAEAESTERLKPSLHADAAHHAKTKSQSKTMVVPPEVHKNFGDKVRRVFDVVRKFSERHPVLTGIVKWGGIAAAAITTASVANNSSGGGGSSGDGESDSSDLFDDYSSRADDSDDYSDSSDRNYPDERSLPKEHTVLEHGQHYHTKDGVIWKEKEPYQRGGKHDDD
ncbi:hypothetical protein ACFC53_08070 [Enterococcus casseliflavus]|uniref:hypothetical protein n=1 Tax=Enterococcus casseliflavus TaxID=37734 RepID=UPI0035D737DD